MILRPDPCRRSGGVSNRLSHLRPHQTRKILRSPCPWLIGGDPCVLRDHASFGAGAQAGHPAFRDDRQTILALLVTLLFVRDLIRGGTDLGFSLQIILWLWFTVLFANFAEAVAEGRGKAQAASLRAARSDVFAKALSGKTLESALGPDTELQLDRGDITPVPALELKTGTVVLSRPVT